MMEFRVSLWDCLALAGALLILVGLALLSWPLLLVAAGAALVAGSLWLGRPWRRNDDDGE